MSTDKKALLDELQQAVIEGNGELAKAATQKCLDAGIPPLETVEFGLRDGLKIVGDRFEKLELFLPDLMLAAEAGNEVMSVLEPVIAADGGESKSAGTIVIGTAKGDIHTIGKNILAMLLKLSGFQVHDLGADVPATTFLEEARKHKADVIAISALMTSTMPCQREVVKLLNDVHERESYEVLVGGAPVTQSWATEIGADGYSETAAGGVSLALKLVAKK